MIFSIGAGMALLGFLIGVFGGTNSRYTTNAAEVIGIWMVIFGVFTVLVSFVFTLAKYLV